MNKQTLNEGLDYHDLEGQIKDVITVDEYAAKMGKDCDVVTITFKVNSKLAADDLVAWLEVGYEFILDASVSEGEIELGKYLVFAEMNRRTSVPERICEILSDLTTLTDISLEDWIVIVGEEKHSADEESLKAAIILSPHTYREEKEVDKELNELREIAQLKTKPLFEEDAYIKGLKALAGM